MSKLDPRLLNKVSPMVGSFLPEFVQSDHPIFVQFLKHYYEFLESAEISLTGSNNYLVQETNTVNYIIDESDDFIVLEDSEAKFTVGETIVGQTSGATATILVDDFDNNNRLFTSANQRFETGEEVIGSSSGASAIISQYRANPVQNIQQLLSYADPDNTISDFLSNFRDSFLEGIPTSLADGISKRNLIKNIKDMYSAKGTKKGHELFFRILFDTTAEISYPRDNILRASDGQWSTDTIIRVVETGTSDFNQVIGQTITGVTSGATAIVSTVTKFREGAVLVAELSLDVGSISGTFVQGELVQATSITLDVTISATVKSILTSANVIEDGAYYNVNDNVTIGTGGNNSAKARIGQIGSGSIDDLIIGSAGTGYSVDDTIIYDNTNTNGKLGSAKIAVVGGALSLESHTDPDQFITEDGDEIVTEDRFYIEQEQTVGELDNLLMEDGGQIVIEEATFTDLGVSAEIGEITKIEMINVGNGYTQLPTITINTSTGSGASLLAKSTSGVGHIEGIDITNFGLDYTSAPTLRLNRNVIITNVSGTFTAGDNLVSHSGAVVSFDSTRGLLQLNTDATLSEGDTLESITGATATIAHSPYATATGVVGTLGTKVGQFVTDRGKVSVDSMRIQDSFFYQDYSYVVRVGQSINEWRDSLKRSVHPSGWNVFGEVTFSSLVSARIQTPAGGVTSFTPDLASLFEVIYSPIVARRLGTATDGTDLIASAVYSERSDVPTGKRELTLTSAVTVSMDIARGSNLLGPTLDLLPKYAFAVPPQTNVSETTVTYGTGATTTAWVKGDSIPHYPGITRMVRGTYNDGTNDIDSGTTNDGAYYTIDQFSNIRIDQVSDGSGNIPEDAYTTKINVPPPAEIVISTV